MTAINDYFSGERLQCLIGMAISVLSLAFALYFLLQPKSEFFKGIAWPFIIISVLLLSICAGVIWRVPRDIDRVTRYAMYEQEKISSEEMPRMQKVMRNFEMIKVVELGLLLIGICFVVFGFVKVSPLLNGVGLGLVIQSAMMYGFDYFAHERAKMYVDFLRSL